MTFMMINFEEQKEMDKMIKRFNELDTDGNGVLSEEELIKGFTESFCCLTREDAEIEVKKVFENIDINMNGNIDMTEFLMATVKKEELASLDRVKKAFMLFDTDNNGYISDSEFYEIFQGLKPSDENDQSSNQAWEEMLKNFDKNNDGKINLDEFITFIQSFKDRRGKGTQIIGNIINHKLLAIRFKRKLKGK